MPLFVRAGAIVPRGPVQQYVDEKPDAPLTITEAGRPALQLSFLGAMGPDEYLFRLTAANEKSDDHLLKDHFALTTRESEVLLWIAKGKSNRDIGDILGNGAGQVGFSRPDAALAGAVSDLHQVAVVQPQVRYAAVGRGLHDGGGRRAEPGVVHHGAQGLDRSRHIEGFVVDGRFQQGVALLQRSLGGGLVAGPEHHAVDAGAAGAAGLAEAGGHAGPVQQLDDAVLHHMAGPGALAQPLNEAAVLAHAAVVGLQPRQPGQQAVGQAVDGVGRTLFQRPQVQPDLHGRAVGPGIRSTQEPVLEDGDGESVGIHKKQLMG